MNKLHSLILFLSFSTVAFSQAPPQEICYQAVATDAAGVEIPMSQIGVRISILQGSETGPEIWIEAHSPETDDFGLFDFNIGTGIRMGGSSQNFIDIPWGSDAFYLKVEMDPAGGADYKLMGINQIVSVPYALYSKASTYADTAAVAQVALNDFDTDPLNEIQDLTYDQATNTLSIDGGSSVTLTMDVNDADSNPTNELQDLSFDGENLSLLDDQGNVTSTVNFGEHTFARSGASFDFPQGIFGNHMVHTMGIYEVPLSKVFYVTGSTREILFSHPTIDGGNLLNHPPTPNMPVFPAGSVITNCNCTGFEVDEESTVQPVILNLSDSANEYQVPADKVLFIKSGIENDATGVLNVEGMDIEFFRPNLSRWTRVMTIPGGATIKRPTTLPSTGDFVLTGYLIAM